MYVAVVGGVRGAGTYLCILTTFSTSVPQIKHT